MDIRVLVWILSLALSLARCRSRALSHVVRPPRMRRGVLVVHCGADTPARPAREPSRGHGPFSYKYTTPNKPLGNMEYKYPNTGENARQTLVYTVPY